MAVNYFVQHKYTTAYIWLAISDDVIRGTFSFVSSVSQGYSTEKNDKGEIICKRTNGYDHMQSLSPAEQLKFNYNTFQVTTVSDTLCIIHTILTS